MPLPAPAKTFTLLTALFVTFAALDASASVTVYQDSDSTNNLVPDAVDGTPNRPAGEEIGNTVTLAAPCALSGATVKFGTTDLNAAPQNITLSIYLNDGPADPSGSGLLQPGTLLSSVTENYISFSSGIVSVDFSFASLSVPGTFTFILSLSPGSSSSILVGAMSDNSAPVIGSVANTLWYGSGAPSGWATNNTWAIADGAVTNDIDATFTAASVNPVPETNSLAYLLFGSVILITRRPGRR